MSSSNFEDNMFQLYNLDLSPRVIQISDKDELAKLLDKKNTIAIDGFPGVGKSTLAKYLSDKLNSTIIEIDHFRTKQTRSFMLNTDDINIIEKVFETISKNKKKIIMEGVLVYDFLMKKAIKVDTFIWIAEENNNNNKYQFIFESYRGIRLEDQIDSTKELLNRFIEIDPLSGVDVFFRNNTWKTRWSDQDG